MRLIPLSLALAAGVATSAFAQEQITPLVNADWLKANSGKENVVVIDIRDKIAEMASDFARHIELNVEAFDADPAAKRAELEAHYLDLTSPFRTAEKFGVLDIIDPRETRAVLCDWVDDAWAVVRGDLGRR